MIKRVDQKGDLFEATLKLKQKLPKFPELEKGVSAENVGLEISAQAAPRKGNRKKTLKAASPKQAAKKMAAKKKAHKT